MKHLEISSDFLSKILKNKQVVSQNIGSMTFNLGEDTLFKFRSDDFLDCFARDDNGNIDYTSLGDVSDKIKQLKERETIINRGKGSPDIYYLNHISQIKKKIKYTKFPIGFMLVDGFRVGYILPKHKGMITLNDLLNNYPLSNEAKQTILQNIRIAMTELYVKNIFLQALNTHNILVNPETYETQFISLEDFAFIRQTPNEAFQRNACRQLNTLRDLIYNASPQSTTDDELTK